jgi:hypothetical protein
MKGGLRRNKLKRRIPIRVKKHVGVVGGEYIFEHAGNTYVLNGKFVNDPRAPEGIRWIATPESNRVIRVLVCEIADSRCELRTSPDCWGRVAPWKGHPHHRVHKGMGGANTDDRIWVMVDGEKWRIRMWACPACHREHHGVPRWSKGTEAQ